jgi:large subunit ribosomal protein L25
MAKREIPKFAGKVREHVGSRFAARERKAGRLPVVIYGHNQAPVFVTADHKELTTLLHKHAHLVQVDVGGIIETCIVKELQWDYLSTTILHVDLARVDLNQKVRISVALEFYGEAIGLKAGSSFLDHPLNEVEVECVATDIPGSIRVDVSNLNVGEEITVKDIKLPEGVKAVTSADHVVAAVRVILEEKTVEGAAGGAEPEVIGKKPEDGAAPAAGDKKAAPAGDKKK